MALVGNYKKFTYTESETDTESVSITYPADLPENDPNYDKRGTTETIEVPVMESSEEIIENVYLVVMGTSLEKNQNSGYNFTYAYRYYANEEDRNQDINSHLFTSNGFFSWNGEGTNLIDLAYEDLKTKPECANLINA